MFNDCIKFIVALLLSLAYSFTWGQSEGDSVRQDTNDILIPVLFSGEDIQESNSQSQDVSGLLQSSRDVYTSTAGFNFSAARFRMRGYSSENMTVHFNGIPVNDPETGWAIWAYWGGLNDVTRYPESKTGISDFDYGFGGIGGASNISLRASSMRKGTRVSYAVTNRTYTNRLMVTHNSGWKNGWAYSISASRRWANEGFVEGTYYDGASYFGSLERKISEDHTINLAVLGAPTVQARRGIALQEVYDLTTNNFYNPYWGYQTGQNGQLQKRNARVRDNHKPYVVLSDHLKLSEKTKLTSSAFYIFGRTGNTNLNWYDASDPRPDYYKNLPSYYTSRDETEEAIAATNAWMTDANTQQINWDQMYFANSKNLYSVENANGTGEAYNGKRSKYILEEYRIDPRHFGANSILNHDLNDRIHITTGLTISKYMSKNYKLLHDLLGGDYWVDVDQFAERDFIDDNAAQNDLQTPNKIIEAGDSFGYDYEIHSNNINWFGQAKFQLRKIDGYVTLNGSNTSFWRVGNTQNGRFPESSLGESSKYSFLNAGIKTGATYKISGRHLVSINAAKLSRAPFSQTAFVSPRTRDQVAPNLESTKINSFDLNYNIRYAGFKMRLTGFYSEFKDQIWSRSFYHDEYRTFINYMMTGVDQTNMGIEFGFEKTIASVIAVNGVISVGDYFYTSRPTATITRDNSEEVLAENKTIYLKNYQVGGTPNQAASIGIKYNSPKYWYVGANFNYFREIYLPPNPDRRTEEALVSFVDTDPQVDEILSQEKLPDGYILNIYGGKSWKIKDKNQYIRLNLNVNNVLNNTSFRTGGFEQLRYDVTDINKFPPKYGYSYGMTYFAMVSYLF